jgi:hypothetical protein
MCLNRMLKQDPSIDRVAEDSPIRPQLLPFSSDVYHVIIYHSQAISAAYSPCSIRTVQLFNSYFV